MMMTVEEIQRDLRLAKDEKEQIKVLAQLNCCSEAYIKRVRDMPTVKPGSNETVLCNPAPVKERKKWTEAEHAEFIRLAMSGADYKDMAKRFDVSQKTIQKRALKYGVHKKKLKALREAESKAETEAKISEYSSGKNANPVPDETNVKSGSCANEIRQAALSSAMDALYDAYAICDVLGSSCNEVKVESFGGDTSCRVRTASGINILITRSDVNDSVQIP